MKLILTPKVLKRAEAIATDCSALLPAVKEKRPDLYRDASLLLRHIRVGVEKMKAHLTNPHFVKPTFDGATTRLPKQSRKILAYHLRNDQKGLPQPFELFRDGRSEHFVKYRIDTVSREPNPDRAWLLGAYMSIKEPGSEGSSLVFHSKDKQEMEKIAARVQNLFGSCPSYRGKGEYQIISLSAHELGPQLAKLTEDASRLPLELLLTKDEQLEFLRGFFQSSSSLRGKSSDRVVLFKKDRNALLNDILVLLGRQGILATLKEDRLFISDKKYFQVLSDLGLFDDKERNDKLKILAAQTRGTVPHSWEAYKIFKEALNELQDSQVPFNGGHLLRLIAKRGGPTLTLQTITTWRDRGVVPFEYQRWERLIAEERKLLIRYDDLGVFRSLANSCRDPSDNRIEAHLLTQKLIDIFGSEKHLAMILGLPGGKLLEGGRAIASAYTEIVNAIKISY